VLIKTAAEFTALNQLPDATSALGKRLAQVGELFFKLDAPNKHLDFRAHDFKPLKIAGTSKDQQLHIDGSQTRISGVKIRNWIATGNIVNYAEIDPSSLQVTKRKVNSLSAGFFGVLLHADVKDFAFDSPSV
jgi:hypothetical protein